MNEPKINLNFDQEGKLKSMTGICKAKDFRKQFEEVKGCWDEIGYI